MISKNNYTILDNDRFLGSAELPQDREMRPIFFLPFFFATNRCLGIGWVTRRTKNGPEFGQYGENPLKHGEGTFEIE